MQNEILFDTRNKRRNKKLYFSESKGKIFDPIDVRVRPWCCPNILVTSLKNNEKSITLITKENSYITKVEHNITITNKENIKKTIFASCCQQETRYGLNFVFRIVFPYSSKRGTQYKA